jgi:hypothetical protein
VCADESFRVDSPEEDKSEIIVNHDESVREKRPVRKASMKRSLRETVETEEESEEEEELYTEEEEEEEDVKPPPKKRGRKPKEKTG